MEQLRSGWERWFSLGQPNEEVGGLAESDADGFVRSVIASMQRLHYKGLFHWDGRSAVEMTAPRPDGGEIAVTLNVRAYGGEEAGIRAGARFAQCAVVLTVGTRSFCFHKFSVEEDAGARSMISPDMIVAVAKHFVANPRAKVSLPETASV